MSWAHYCSNLILGPKRWQNTHICNEDCVFWGGFITTEDEQVHREERGEREKTTFLAKLCTTILISLLAAAFGHTFQ